MHEEIIATIPQAPYDEQALEVAITYDAADHAQVELREMTWANGIGCYRQKTLTLDAATAEVLLKSLGQARRRLNPRDRAQEDGKVIPFPVTRSGSALPQHTLARAFGTEEMKKKCCERFKRKGRACKKCPTMAKLSNKGSKKLLQVRQKG